MKHLARCLPLLLLLASGCSAAPLAPAVTTTPSAVPPSATPLPSVTPAPSLTATETATLPPTETLTATPSDTPTQTPIPTYINLRGMVNVEKANCRYGPGEPYLYKYGLIGGSNLEIIGRNAGGAWIEIRAIGGTNPCWVKASLLDIQGDVMNVAPILPEDVKLPSSPYYVPPSAVHAERVGESVTLTWNPVSLRAGDDSGQYPYLVEAWTCQGGQLVFTPYGTYDTALNVPDEAGCSQPSHGRVYAVEKHGYTRPREVDWPASP